MRAVRVQIVSPAVGTHAWRHVSIQCGVCNSPWRGLPTIDLEFTTAAVHAGCVGLIMPTTMTNRICLMLVRADLWTRLWPVLLCAACAVSVQYNIYLDINHAQHAIARHYVIQNM
jgi:hypothetical protein